MRPVRPWLMLLGLLSIQSITAQVPAVRPLRISAFGASGGRGAEVCGTATLFAAPGAKVKLVALTNGDVGHVSMAGGPLAQSRKAEVEACHERIGVETTELDTSMTAS